MRVVLDAAQMREREAAHTYLAEALQLPAYYGRNLDALYDCLTESDDLELVFINVPDPAEKSYFHRIRHVCAQAALSHPELHMSILLQGHEHSAPRD